MATIKQIEAKSTDSSIELHLSADLIYPVGSIYMSVNSTNPSTLFGGTWEQIKDKFLLSCGDTYANGSTGGEATHTLTIDEMPSHNHSAQNYFTGFPSTQYRTDTDKYYTPMAVKTGGGGSITQLDDVLMAKGGSKAHNNMPPYLAVYVWKRTK